MKFSTQIYNICPQASEVVSPSLPGSFLDQLRPDGLCGLDELGEELELRGSHPVVDVALDACSLIRELAAELRDPGAELLHEDLQRVHVISDVAGAAAGAAERRSQLSGH